MHGAHRAQRTKGAKEKRCLCSLRIFWLGIYLDF